MRQVTAANFLDEPLMFIFGGVSTVQLHVVLSLMMVSLKRGPMFAVGKLSCGRFWSNSRRRHTSAGAPRRGCRLSQRSGRLPRILSGVHCGDCLLACLLGAPVMFGCMDSAAWTRLGLASQAAGWGQPARHGGTTTTHRPTAATGLYRFVVSRSRPGGEALGAGFWTTENDHEGPEDVQEKTGGSLESHLQGSGQGGEGPVSMSVVMCHRY